MTRTQKAIARVAVVTLALVAGLLGAVPAQAADYDPYNVSVSYSDPVCNYFNGELNGELTVTSLQAPFNDLITVELDGVVIDGPRVLDGGFSWFDPQIVPASTPAGEHTLKVYNQAIFEVFSRTFTLPEPCVQQNPEDFTQVVGPPIVNPNTGIAAQGVELKSSSVASRGAAVFVEYDGNTELSWAGTVPANGSYYHIAEVPLCKPYTLFVSFGYSPRSFEQSYSAIGCPPKATISTVPGVNNLTKKVTVTNVSAEQLKFVVFAFAENGASITKTPSPGSTSFAVNVGQSVTFDATVNPLPAGQTRYYFLLLPTVGDEEIGRSGLFDGTYTLPAPKAFKMLAPPKVTGTAKRGKTLKAYVGKWSPAATSYKYQWYKNGRGVKAATKSTFKVPKSYKKGTKLSVKVTVLKAGYKSASKVSSSVKVKK